MNAGVVIAGGGLAAQRCAETLRRSGYRGPLRVVCAERRLPYDRPALSKEVLADPAAEAQLGFRARSWYDEHSVEPLLGVRARGLNTLAARLELSDGRSLPYEQLLIATGSRPRSLPLLERFANVSTLSTLEDARALRTALAPGARIAIIGAGFIGGEVASAARRAGASATVVEAGPAPLAGVLGDELGGWFAELHRSEGVMLALGRRVAAAQDSDAGADGAPRVGSLTLDDGRVLRCDHVVVGIGSGPNLGWLEGTGLDPRGVRTDAAGRSAFPRVFAAGDAAAAYEPLLDRHLPGSHWEAAARQGARAARAMLGLDPGPDTVASFWSDVHGVRVHYLGHASLADDLEIDGDMGARDFTATFTRRGAPVAVLLVGRPRMLPAARALLAHPTTSRPERSAA